MILPGDELRLYDVYDKTRVDIVTVIRVQYDGVWVRFFQPDLGPFERFISYEQLKDHQR